LFSRDTTDCHELSQYVSRIYYPVQLVVRLLFVFAPVHMATKPKNHIQNRHSASHQVGTNIG
jgi:hypothetical protein